MTESLEVLVSDVVRLFRQKTDVDDGGVLKLLMERGLTEQQAEELTVFVPMAFCRVMLGDSGVTFSEQYILMSYGSGASVTRSLSSQPIYRAALEIARGEEKSGVARNDFLAVAGRTAEFNAISQALDGGSKPEDLVLTPPVIFTNQEFKRP